MLRVLPNFPRTLIHTHKPTLVIVAELASLLCRMGFPLEGFVVDIFFAEEEDEEEEDFILASSASKAGARVLTTASKSDCVARDWEASGTKITSVSQKLQHFGGCKVSCSVHYKTKKRIVTYVAKNCPGMAQRL